jgi:hypothetical protein
MSVTKRISPRNNILILLTLLLLLLSICQCLPQLQDNIRVNNNNFRVQGGSQNRNRNQVTRDSPLNGGQRNLVGGFRPSNFGNEFVRFPDNVVRPIGGRQQQSPFRNPSSNVETFEQGNRRPAQQARPTPRSQRRPRILLPAIPITTKFTRPEFDVRGRTLTFGRVPPNSNDLLPDFRGPRPASSSNNNRNQNRITTSRPSIRRPQNSNLGPDLKPKLPVFGQSDLILKATEELRNSDVNQNVILPSGNVNAGVLPLAIENEEDQFLGFFPPFNKPKGAIKIQPK